jgi:hypothetical protein
MNSPLVIQLLQVMAVTLLLVNIIIVNVYRYARSNLEALDLEDIPPEYEDKLVAKLEFLQELFPVVLDFSTVFIFVVLLLSMQL